MGKVYYNQADPRWAQHPYPSQELPHATIKSGGCGVTCAAMVVSSAKEIIYPNQMGDIARENGYRQNGGTAWGMFQYVADRWGFETRNVRSSYEALQACKDGYFVVILCGAGLWTTGGHYILAVGAQDDKIEIYDPYLYNGKFNINGRAGKVNLIGNSAWVQIDIFKANSEAHAFFAYKIENNTNIPTIDPQVRYVNTNSANLNVRAGDGTNNPIVGTLPKGTQVLVYEERNGWSRIGDGKWVSSQYLSTSAPQTSRTMYVINVSSHLNVRAGAGTGNAIVGQLNNGAAVTVINSNNGWYQISSPINGWVSANYIGGSPSNATIPNTVGQLKRFKNTTIIYQNSNLTGTPYTYLPQTQVKILANISNSVDKVYVVKTGRIGYVNKSAY